jgi:hypothetical protein
MIIKANNARFCLLTSPGQYPNLASRVLALNQARLCSDWQEAYGHPILLVESFVDTQLFRGTSYKAAGWQAVGLSAGFKRVSEDFYEAHDRPKQLYTRELVKHAARKLRQRQLPQPLQKYERPVDPSCQMPGGQMTSLWQVLHRQVSESRSLKGLRHKQATVLTITFAFLLSGGQGGHRAVASFAQDLTPTQRAAVRCWFNARTRTYEAPTENCIYRVLKAVPVMEFQQALWLWQHARHGAQDGSVVVLDGKALRGSHALYYGHHLQGEWWRKDLWEKQVLPLPAIVVNLLEPLRRLIATMTLELTARTRDVEAAAPATLPAGLGKLTSEILDREIADWDRFQNRRQVASYTGLCPSKDTSSDRRFQGSINKHGNRRLRPVLIECAWRLTVFQPGYRAVKKWKRLSSQYGGSNRRNP